MINHIKSSFVYKWRLISVSVYLFVYLFVCHGLSGKNKVGEIYMSAAASIAIQETNNISLSSFSCGLEYLYTCQCVREMRFVYVKCVFSEIKVYKVF